MVLLLDTTDTEKYKFVFANTKIEKILNCFKPFFLQREIKKNVVLNFFRPIYDNYTNYFILEIEEKQRFLKNNKWLEYYPVFIDPREKNLKEEIKKNIKRRKRFKRKDRKFIFRRNPSTGQNKRC